MIFFLLRRLSPRTRLITGVVLVVAGVVVVAISAVVPALLIHGIILAVIGALLWMGAVASARRAHRTGDQPTADSVRPREGRAHVR